METTLSLQITYRETAALLPYAMNNKYHDADNVAQIAASIKRFGFVSPVLIDPDGVIIAGHGRVMAAQSLGMAEVPTITLGHLSESERRAYRIADNKLTELSVWNIEALQAELALLAEDDFDLTLTGFSLDEVESLLAEDFLPAQTSDWNVQRGESQQPPSPPDTGVKGSLSDRFLLPPFTVLNAREGWWQQRKRAWLDLGIQSEVGRGQFTGEPTDESDALIWKNQSQMMNILNPKRAQVAGGMVYGDMTVYDPAHVAPGLTGTSVFDPVLCELVYLWFSANGDKVLDPFAGGSVRGIVASRLCRHYDGIDLRGEQIAANREQGAYICEPDFMPRWTEGDSRNVAQLAKTKFKAQAGAYNLLFTCPPYANLEVYSDDAADLSTLQYPEFLAAYRKIIAACFPLMADDTFAAVVVGEVRGDDGNYLQFVPDTVRAFTDAGWHFYNEAILVTMVGTLPIRVTKQFNTSRKLGKSHQNLLVFVKGDARAAAARCGSVELIDDANQQEQ